jgi:transposase
MARFRCRMCGEEGSFVYGGRLECPNCGSADVQFSLSIEELADDDPLIEELKRPSEDGEKNGH